MTRNRLLLFLLAALILAACAGNPDVPEGTDWCYRWDFSDPGQTPGSYGFGIGAGSWQATVGIVTDANGNLNITYTSDLTVAPTRAIVTIENMTLGDPAVSIEAAGTIFGIPVNVDQNVPGGSEYHSLPVPFNAPSSDTIGTNINVSMSASSEMAVNDLTVYGRGANPLGSSNCDNFVPTPVPTTAPTATPFPPTNTIVPTNTPGPTNTPSPTYTPSITPTSTCDGSWTFYMDFAADEYAADTSLFNSGYNSLTGTYTSGQGFQTTQGGGWSGLGLEVVFPTEIVSAGLTGFRVKYTVVGPGLLENRFYSPTYAYSLGYPTNYFRYNTHSTFDGYYTLPGGAAYVPYQAGHNTIRMTQGNGVTNVTGYIRGIEFVGTGTEPYCATSTPTLTPTSTFTNTPGPTATRTPNPTWTTDPLITPTLTRTPTRTLIPITAPPTWLRTATLPAGTSTPDIVLTWIAGTTTATYAGTGGPPGGTPTPVTSTLTPSRTPTPTAPPGSTITPNPGGIGTAIPGGSEYDDLDQVGDAVLNTSQNIFELVIAWLGNITVPLGRIVDAWFNTAPAPPPALPRCHTDPLESDLCAIWYIMEFTIFSGPVGSLLVPIGTAVVDLVVIFTFMKQARAIIARLMEIVKTG